MKLLSVRELSSEALNIQQWDISEQQQWCLLGTVGSGKSQLAKILSDPENVAFSAVRADYPQPCICVGFEAQQQQAEAEAYNNDTDFMDQLDYGSTGRELLQQSGAEAADIDVLAERFGIQALMEKGFRMFSSGEIRKLLTLRAVLSRPALLLLDEPFEGLDQQSRETLSGFLRDLISTQPLLLFISQRQDVPDWCTHLAVLHQSRLIASGPCQQVLTDPAIDTLFSFSDAELPELPATLTEPATFDPLLTMEHTTVRYGDTVQFSDFSWQLRPGEHTLIAGPNGAGKSTLLQLISGDHPQCFNNGITAFGYSRGQGESIWDIKKHIGLVSGSLHQDYRVAGNALTVVASGFHDSIGLYRSLGRREQQIARQWLAITGLEQKASTAFRQLSWGEQRLVLIARALVKQPPLLLLDEPTLGLDDRNRFMVLACLERIARLQSSTCLFVSHRQDEHLSVFQHRLEFRKTGESDSGPLYRIHRN